jgi:metal-sulfur cluster biosynthetic enzyme
MTAAELNELVRGRLADVLDPCSVAAGNPMNVLDMGLVKDVVVSGASLHVQMRLTSPQCPMLQHFVSEVNRVMADLPEIHRVTVRGDSGMDWTPQDMTDEGRRSRHDHLLRLVRSDRSTPAPLTPS